MFYINNIVILFSMWKGEIVYWCTQSWNCEIENVLMYNAFTNIFDSDCELDISNSIGYLGSYSIYYYYYYIIILLL